MKRLLCKFRGHVWMLQSFDDNDDHLWWYCMRCKKRASWGTA